MPRLKPWLWRLTAMISSSRLMLSMQRVRSVYLHMDGQGGVKSLVVASMDREVQKFAFLMTTTILL